MGQGTTPLLRVEDLSVTFASRGRRGTAVQAVRDVTFEVESGTTLALVGESGCGKTTVARTIVGLNRRATGSVVFDGTELVDLSAREWRSIRPRIQMVFQDPYSSLNPRWTIRRLVAEPLLRFGRGRGLGETEDELLGEVGLAPALKARRPRDLSGGQRQRVGIARALAASPELLVCDEPVSALDVSVQAQVLNLLDRLRADHNLTCVYISHNLATVRWLADRVAVMYAGRLVELGSVERVFAEPRHPYTVALLSATLTSDPHAQAARRPIVPTGDPPSPQELRENKGCLFRSRCWLYEQLGRPDRCEQESPPQVRAPRQAACHFPLHEPGHAEKEVPA
ncbi:ABC transporter ATP-binding protein [Dactylosporangium roseum]|uniref:ABC transporter ATP-binding protein n=1 Tax=Dactylosporangium roseum TaxID=47989 RepID=A0ABY5ZE36_9ACTN|nr:oligopeptide/dipeptide ABC transporter ATP-binding protein [Dactylosporangium roseum]UWZ39210.1 ABC transporter ATP-binding protein [Dactylosporangium roseum]